MNTKPSIVTSAADGYGKPLSIRSMDNSHRSQREQKESFVLSNHLSISRGCFLAVMALTAAALLGRALPSARASLLVYEPFNYAPGSNLIGQTATGLGFTGSWTSWTNGNATIESGSLSEGNLATSGNSLSGGADNGPSVNLSSPVAATVGNPLWVSFLMQTPATTTDINNNTIGALDLIGTNSNGTNSTAIGYTNGSFVLQTENNGVIGSSVSPNTTYLMVLEDIANSSGTSTLNLWINPATGVEYPIINSNMTYSPTDSIGNISSIGMLDGYYSNSYDEIRIGTTYADVTPAVPEPDTLRLMGIGSLALIGGMALRRRLATTKI